MAGKPTWEVFEDATSQTRARCMTLGAALLAKQMLETERPDVRYGVRQRRLFTESTLKRIVERGIRTVIFNYNKETETEQVTEQSKIEIFLGFSGVVPQVGVYEASTGFRVVVSHIVAESDEDARYVARAMWENHPQHDDYLAALYCWRETSLTSFTNFKMGAAK